MLTLIWIILSLYVLSFAILLFFVKNEESKEEEPGTLPTIMLTTATRSLLITGILVGFMFVPMFVMFIAKRFIGFNSDISSIVFIAGVVVVYILIFDSLLQVMIQNVIKYQAIHYLFFNLLRFFIFMGITSFVSLSTEASISVSLILTVLFIIIDVGDRLFSKKEQPHA